MSKERANLLKHWASFQKAWDDWDDEADDSNKEDHNNYYFEVESDYIAAMSELEIKEIQLQPSPSTSLPTSDVSNTHVNIEVIRMAIDPPTFSGHWEDWVSFRDLFASIIIENTTLNDIHGLQYLRGSCKGKAAEVIQDIAVTVGNFQVAWFALTGRYNKERRIVSK